MTWKDPIALRATENTVSFFNSSSTVVTSCSLGVSLTTLVGRIDGLSQVHALLHGKLTVFLSCLQSSI